ncbi:mannitol-1-phosphate 5-dehydrogenase [Jeotgalibacillus haloalkalitolerans]|uniref:Mannitol-1-phosphate 5-dehydrogenase n=1 Tax=Jeotgalibacillus haloalkalitolerans TaxID=3104292 RepID=A0ABU5KHF5_9BACL|nr:mannitol-1-phosphate 5-dehydrogenase [Jeotgalibacillus sp. HH7-29]MDZ5710675.1 mannitol-1-phosphate 5-dehydrogenase [Jeotgalibacillus sp. HH7-29]
MRALHFGAGNIGKGFIGYLLSKNGYEVCFVDVNQQMIDHINSHNRYDVELLSDDRRIETISPVSALNSITQKDAVIERIVSADVITMSVGVQNLSKVAGVLAEGLKKRAAANRKNINVMANENAINASSTLRKEVAEHLTQEEMNEICTFTAFPNTAVDRLALSRQSESGEIPMVEPFYEWVIDQSEKVDDGLPGLQGVTYTQDLTPFIERKLYIVNMGHAAAAYLGHLKGYPTIRETLENTELEALVKGAMKEAAGYIVQTFQADPNELDQFIEKTVGRFKNPHVSDDVKRVGRAPVRKLGSRERLVHPTVSLFEKGHPVENLTEAIAAGFLFNAPEDEEAEKLQALIAENGIEKAVQIISGIKIQNLQSKIVSKYNTLKNG